MATENRSAGREDSRSRILQAVDRVLDRHGFKGLTIEKVAAEAGMSKGGVLHYFASKDELIKASLLGFQERTLARRDALFESLPDGPERLAKATLLGVMEMRKAESYAGHYRSDLLENSEYREIIGSFKKRIYFDLLKNARQPARILSMLFLLDGMWLNDTYKPSPIPKQNVKLVQARIRDFLDSFDTEYA